MDKEFDTFLIEFKEELSTLVEKHPTPASYIKDVYGIRDSMDIDFPKENQYERVAKALVTEVISLRL